MDLGTILVISWFVICTVVCLVMIISNIRLRNEIIKKQKNDEKCNTSISVEAVLEFGRNVEKIRSQVEKIYKRGNK